MFARCLQLFAALAFLALVAGAPSQAFAHAGETHAAAPKAVESAREPAAVFAEAKAYSLSAPADQSKETPHLRGCSGLCCACSGSGCQGAATLPAFAEDVALTRASPVAPYDAISPPRRAQTSLEHPPKSFV
jgi:hypothetical protein